MIENATANRRGFYSSWTIAVQGIAVVFAGIIVVLLSLLFALTENKNAMSEWGWRIPFFIGVVLGPVGCWLRLRLDNDSPSTAPTHHSTAAADKMTVERTLSLLKQHSRTLICGILLVIGATVSFFISSYYYAAFAVHYFGFDQIYSHLGILLGGIITFTGSLYFGALSDRIGRKGLIVYGRLALIILAYPSFWLLIHYPYPAMLFIVITVMVTLAMMSSIPAVVAISEMLPTRIRAVGFALVYSIGVAIFGGFAQFFATEAITRSGNLTAPSWYLIGCLLFSSIALLMFRDRYQDEKLIYTRLT